jgi:hypothetical protein
MVQGRKFKEIFGNKLERSGKRGKPTLRWLEDVEKDLR